MNGYDGLTLASCDGSIPKFYNAAISEAVSHMKSNDKSQVVPKLTKLCEQVDEVKKEIQLGNYPKNYPFYCDGIKATLVIAWSMKSGKFNKLRDCKNNLDKLATALKDAKSGTLEDNLKQHFQLFSKVAEKQIVLIELAIENKQAKQLTS